MSHALAAPRLRFRRPKFPNLNSWKTLFLLWFFYMVNCIARGAIQAFTKHSLGTWITFIVVLPVWVWIWSWAKRGYQRTKRAEERGPMLPPPWQMWAVVLFFVIFVGLCGWIPGWPL